MNKEVAFLFGWLLSTGFLFFKKEWALATISVLFVVIVWLVL